MTVSASDIVTSARSWIGTRFQHQGRLKKTHKHAGGVDCLGLLIGVADELDLRCKKGNPLKAFDKIDYSHYPNSEMLRDTLRQLIDEYPLTTIQEGDIVLMKIDSSPQHLGIISNYNADANCVLGLIHAYAQTRKVVEHMLDSYWKEKIIAIYRL